MQQHLDFFFPMPSLSTVSSVQETFFSSLAFAFRSLIVSVAEGLADGDSSVTVVVAGAVDGADAAMRR